MLRSYLRRERRSDRLGAVHVEVPFGGPSGGTSRRLDAVRFSSLDNRIRRYRGDVFAVDLSESGPIELIEVTPRLNRPVIGQLIAAEILVRKEWKLPAHRPLDLVAVVAQVDAALALVCAELGIRVEQVRHPPPGS